jgi:hypothetical protein
LQKAPGHKESWWTIFLNFPHLHLDPSDGNPKALVGVSIVCIEWLVFTGYAPLLVC